jgi:hypothetical protein
MGSPPVRRKTADPLRVPLEGLGILRKTLDGGVVRDQGIVIEDEAVPQRVGVDQPADEGQQEKGLESGWDAKPG